MKVLSLYDTPFIKKGGIYEIIEEFDTFYVVRGENDTQTCIGKYQGYADITTNFNLNPRALRVKILEGATLNAIEKIAIMATIDEEDSRWNYKD